MRVILFPFFLVLSANVAIAAGDAAKGKDLYLKRCRACHAEDGAGTPAMVKKYGDKMKPLFAKEVQAKNDADIAKAFSDSANHKGLLKALQPGDLDNVIAHIRTLKAK